MEAFFTIILFLVLFFWLVGRFAPLLLGWWIKRKVSKLRKMGEDFSDYNQQNFTDGETYVKNEESPKNKIVGKNVGEYVDYQETKE